MKKLQQAFEIFEQKNTFEKGQIVEWKLGMKYKRADGPFVVVEVIDPPIISPSRDSGSGYFREPLDLILAHIDDDGDGDGVFVTYHFDSRRMQPVK